MNCQHFPTPPESDSQFVTVFNPIPMISAFCKDWLVGQLSDDGVYLWKAGQSQHRQKAQDAW